MIVHKYYYHDTRVKRYAETLARAGARVDILCPRDPATEGNAPGSSIRVFTIPVIHGDKNLAGYLAEYGIALIFYAGLLLRLYAANRYQIIHVHNMPDFLVFAALIPRLLGAKVILDIHDPMPEFYMSKFQSGSDLFVRLMRFQEKVSTGFSDAIITANSNFKDNLRRRGIPADKLTVVNNMPDYSIFNRRAYEQERGRNSGFLLIYPGSIAARYGLDVAIRAMPHLMSKVPGIRLLIVGKQNEYAAELAGLADKLGVRSVVEFRPQVPVTQVPLLTAQADVGIYTALPDAHMSIATPTKVLEYAAMGIPIIASRLEVLQDLFTEDSVMFIEPGNEAQFAERVITLFEHPEKRAELVRNADAVFVNAHAWSDEAGRYLQLLDRLLSARGEMISRGARGGKTPGAVR